MDDFYTVNQVAQILKVHPLSVRRYLKSGKLKAYRVGGSVRIALADLNSFTEHFTPQSKPAKLSPANPSHPFSEEDPLLRLRGRGLSMAKLEAES